MRQNKEGPAPCERVAGPEGLADFVIHGSRTRLWKARVDVTMTL